MRTKTTSILLAAVFALPALAHAGLLTAIDCNNDGILSIGELVSIVSIALGRSDLSACSSADINGDGLVRIDEVVDAAVVAVFGGGPKVRRIDAVCTDGVIDVFGAKPSLDSPVPGLVIGSVAESPGMTAEIQVNLATMGQPVVASQNDIIFDPAIVELDGLPFAPCTKLVPDKSLATDVVTCPGPPSDPCPLGDDGKMRLRAVIIDTNSPTEPISDSTALYSCTFTISAVASDSTVLKCANAIVAVYGNRAAPTPTVVASPVCVGDCNLDHQVLIDELVRSVAIALDRLEANVCPAIDCHGTGNVTVDCLIRAVNAALSGCPVL